MARYIELDALVAEIERLEKKNNESENVYDFGTEHALKSILSFIDTIEVKEIGVDLGDPKGDKSAKHIIDTKTLEVKEVDLDFMLHEYWGLSPKITIDCLESATMTKDEMIRFAKHFIGLGAKLKELQFEKNRLVHCEALTEEQAKIESDFVAKHLKDNNRTPTFIDAIEYGMRLHKEQMMKDAKSGIGNYDNYIKFEDGTWIDLDPSEQLKPAFNVNEGDKVKVIVIKEK